MTLIDSQQEVYQQVNVAFRESPDWVTFFRRVLGVDGIVRRAYPSREAMEEFETTETYRQILTSLVQLREKGSPPSEEEEPTKVITIRLPRSLHDALKREAHDHETSMNQLCIAKLVQIINHDLVKLPKPTTT